ncbi:MAG: hypothetical protein WDA21_01535 [Bacilli bacterium]
MKRIRVKSILKNETEKEKNISNVDGLIIENKIKYQELDKTKITLTFKDNGVELIRENEESKINISFIEKKETNSKYYIKKLDFRIPVRVFTKELKIDENIIIIKYNLLLNESHLKSYEYIVFYKEW